MPSSPTPLATEPITQAKRPTSPSSAVRTTTPATPQAGPPSKPYSSSEPYSSLGVAASTVSAPSFTTSTSKTSATPASSQRRNPRLTADTRSAASRPATPTQLPPVSPGNICHDPCVKVRDFAFPETDLRHWGHPDGHTAVAARRKLAQAPADPRFDSTVSTTATNTRSLATRADGRAVHAAVTSAKRRPPPPESDDDDNPGTPYSPSARRIFDSEVEDTLSDISVVSDRPADALGQLRNGPTRSLASSSSPSSSASPAVAADPPSSPSAASASSAAVASTRRPHTTGITDRFATQLQEDDEDNAGQEDLGICPPWLGAAISATLPTRPEYHIARCTSAHRFSAVSEWELAMSPGDIILTVREAASNTPPMSSVPFTAPTNISTNPARSAAHQPPNLSLAGHTSPQPPPPGERWSSIDSSPLSPLLPLPERPSPVALDPPPVKFAAQIAQFVDYQTRAYGEGWVVALRVAVTVRSPSSSASDKDCWEARLVDLGLVPAGFLRADPGP
ncbi:hypothetical protein HK405_011237 [Cladochytrium tenue]|nr:hypothetical protein HK405_011237 [Cladochytrium tenue]